MDVDAGEALRLPTLAGGRLDQLQDCMRVYAEVVTQPFGICLIRVGDEEVPEPSRNELRRLKSEIDLAISPLGGATALQQGLLAPCDPTITAFVISRGLSWLARWYQPRGPTVPTRSSSNACNCCCKGCWPARRQTIDHGACSAQVATAEFASHFF